MRFNKKNCKRENAKERQKLIVKREVHLPKRLPMGLEKMFQEQLSGNNTVMIRTLGIIIGRIKSTGYAHVILGK